MAFGPTHMKAVLQEDLTGCGIACVAGLANVSYQQVKSVAMTWGMTLEIRSLVQYGLRSNFVKPLWHSIPAGRTPFRSWQALPPLALPATEMAPQKQSGLLALGYIGRGRRTSGVEF